MLANGIKTTWVQLSTIEIQAYLRSLNYFVALTPPSPVPVPTTSTDVAVVTWATPVLSYYTAFNVTCVGQGPYFNTSWASVNLTNVTSGMSSYVFKYRLSSYVCTMLVLIIIIIIIIQLICYSAISKHKSSLGCFTYEENGQKHVT